MHRRHFWHANGIVRATAQSRINIALWDILGKVHGVPVHRLWGGPLRDYARLYCHLGGGRLEDFYEPASQVAARVIAEAPGSDASSGGRVRGRLPHRGAGGESDDRCGDP